MEGEYKAGKSTYLFIYSYLDCTHLVHRNHMAPKYFWGHMKKYTVANLPPTVRSF